MKLKNKKSLASRTLGIGKERIVFNSSRLNEIKEAITKQDIKDLVSSNAILIKEIKGRRLKRKKGRRRQGSIRKKLKHGKRRYLILARKFRKYIAQLRKSGDIKDDLYFQIRKEIKSSAFKDLTHLKERIKGVEK